MMTSGSECGDAPGRHDSKRSWTRKGYLGAINLFLAGRIVRFTVRWSAQGGGLWRLASQAPTRVRQPCGVQSLRNLFLQWPPNGDGASGIATSFSGSADATVSGFSFCRVASQRPWRWPPPRASRVSPQAGNRPPQARRRPGQLRTSWTEQPPPTGRAGPTLSHCTPARRPNCRGKQPTTSSPPLMGFARLRSAIRILRSGMLG